MSRKVELVRLGADEGETLPGPPPRFRPAADVFNKDNKRMKRADEETIKKALEGKKRKFVSEAELTQNKELYGERLEDGTFSGKTLTEAIIAQREEKDAKFKDNWKQMKQGKNRPLEDDELHFLQQLADEESAKEKAIREQEQKALARMQTTRQAATTAVPLAPSSHIRHKPASKRHKVVPRAAKPEAGPAAAGPDAAPLNDSALGTPSTDAHASAGADLGGLTPRASRGSADGAANERRPLPGGSAGHGPGDTGRAPPAAVDGAGDGAGGSASCGAAPAGAGRAASGLLCGYSSSSESESGDE